MSGTNLMSATPCTATSKAKGKQCGRTAIQGGNVCRYHGGAAPQVIAAAHERIKALVDPAIEQMAKLLEHAESEQVRAKMIAEILDRAGLSAKQVIEANVTHTTFTIEVDGPGEA